MVELSPEVVVWEYTLGCNSKCIHCGSNAASARKNELTAQEVLDLVDQIADIGFKLVVLSGGEPTLRNDWVNTAKRIQAKGMKFGIISNALAWTGETVENLVSLNPYAVGFSVDGEEQLHDYLRGIPGSHKKVFNYIKELNNKGVVTCAVTAVNNKNLKELVQIRNRLMVYGVDAWQLQLASPMGRMAENRDMILNEDEHYELGKFIIETRERLPRMNVQAADCLGYFGTLENRLRNHEWEGCSAGIRAIGIDSDGNIRGCLSIRTDKAIEGNIRETPLKELWLSNTTFKYNRQFSINNLGDKCKGCDYGTNCKGGCQSQSIAFFDEFHNAPYCFLRYERGKPK